MSDRVKGLFVALDKNYRDDDVQVIIDAISMIKGVTRVEMDIVDSQDFFARERVKSEIKKNLLELYDKI